MTNEPHNLSEFDQKLFGIEWINVDDLIVDEIYQRPKILAEIKAMTDHWEWNAVRTLAVSLRHDDEGRSYYAVIDGQQRLTAARNVGIQKLPCQVFLDLTREEEARLFTLLNTAKRPIPNDMFRAKLAAGDEQAKLIMICVRNANWEVDLENTHRGKGEFGSRTINSAVVLTQVFNRGGVLHLTQVLNICHGWYGQHLAGSVDIISGISRLLYAHGKDIDLSRLTEKLANETPDGIIGQAGLITKTLTQGTDSRATAVVKVLTIIYNKGLSPAKRLHTIE